MGLIFLRSITKILNAKASYWFIEVDPNSIDKILSEPEPLFRFDLETLEPNEIKKHFNRCKEGK